MRVPRPALLSIARLVAVAVLLAFGSSGTPPSIAADKGDVGKSLKGVGAKMKNLGKQIGEAGEEAGEEIADASKKIWFKGKQVSLRLLRKTQAATRGWWDEVIDGKDRTLRDLRSENARLKRELAEASD